MVVLVVAVFHWGLEFFLNHAEFQSSELEEMLGAFGSSLTLSLDLQEK